MKIIMLFFILTIFLISCTSNVEDETNSTFDNEPMTSQECEDEGGIPITTVNKGACAENEKNIGPVVDFPAPYICCVP